MKLVRSQKEPARTFVWPVQRKRLACSKALNGVIAVHGCHVRSGHRRGLSLDPHTNQHASPHGAVQWLLPISPVMIAPKPDFHFRYETCLTGQDDTEIGDGYAAFSTVQNRLFAQGLTGTVTQYYGSSVLRPPLQREAACWNSDPHARTATKLCHRIHWKRASAPTSARSAQHALILSWTTSAPIAVAASFPDPSDHRRTGKAITILAKTPPAIKSNTDPWTQRLMHCSRRKFGPYPLKNGSFENERYRSR
jgi:hypothetical protein